jgi:hypothetical protein
LSHALAQQQAGPVVDPQCPLCGGSRLAAPQQAEPVELSDEAIEAAITEWFRCKYDFDYAPFRHRMQAAIKAANDFKGEE